MRLNETVSSITVAANPKMPKKNFTKRYANPFHVAELLICASSCRQPSRPHFVLGVEDIGAIFTCSHGMVIMRSKAANPHQAAIVASRIGMPIQIMRRLRPILIIVIRKTK